MEYRMAATTRQPRDTQLAIGDRAAPVWTDLGYAGDANGIAFYFAAHPDTRASVQLCYDRQTGGTTSKPPCPALEPLARFATLVRDSHAALRQSAFTDAQLAALLEVGVLLARARPDDESWRADVEAIRAEVKRRERLGPHAERQRTGAGGVTRAANEELFGD
jgi:hypothetical protein